MQNIFRWIVTSFWPIQLFCILAFSVEGEMQFLRTIDTYVFFLRLYFWHAFKWQRKKIMQIFGSVTMIKRIFHSFQDEVNRNRLRLRKYANVAWMQQKGDRLLECEKISRRNIETDELHRIPDRIAFYRDHWFIQMLKSELKQYHQLLFSNIISFYIISFII